MRWLVLLCVACGPVAYVNQVTRGAQSAVDEARAAQAEKYAPYWWTRATIYLHMAREVAGRADFQGANHFGRLAEEAAQQATHEAQTAKVQPPRAVPKLDDVAPAKDGP